MTFRKEKIGEFLEVFHASKHQIRSFPGCLYLELLQDADNDAVLITHSHWSDTASLENYRASPLFEDTWSKTKPLFDAKPMAFSMKLVETVKLL
jgi:quinol monooxygenase YgiN